MDYKEIMNQKTSNVTTFSDTSCKSELNLKEDRLAIYKCILEDLEMTYKKKNHDYGNSVGDTYQEYGDISFMIRITDKFNRLKSLLKKKERMVLDESIDDTILDMANYSLLWLVERTIKEDDIVE